MSTKHIIYTYVMTLLMIIFSIIGLRKVIRKENLVEITILNVRIKEEIIENREILNNILRVLIIVMCISAYVAHVIPSIIDLPRVINGDYCIIEGVSMRQRDYDDSKLERNIIIQDKDGKKHNISCDYYEEINIGDRFKILYLPNTKVGSVIEHKKY